MCYLPSVNKRIENTEEQRKVSLSMVHFMILVGHGDPWVAEKS